MNRDGFWRRTAQDGIAAAAEALFPPNDAGAPDHRDTDMVARTLAYIDELPPPQQRLLLLLFVFTQLLAPLLIPAFGRFSRLPLDRRTRAVRAWRASRFVLVRHVGDALKASLTMMYMSHPRVSEYIGERRSCTTASVRVEAPVAPPEISAAAESLPPTRQVLP